MSIPCSCLSIFYAYIILKNIVRKKININIKPHTQKENEIRNQMHIDHAKRCKRFTLFSEFEMHESEKQIDRMCRKYILNLHLRFLQERAH